MLGRILNGIKASRLWIKALDAAAKNSFDEAFSYLEQMPDTKRPVLEIQILRAYLLYELRRLQDSYDLCSVLLNEILMDNSLDDNLRSYLTAYVLWVAKCARMSGSFDKSKNVPRLETVDWASIDLKLIPNHWKVKFSLPIHPDWGTER